MKAFLKRLTSRKFLAAAAGVVAGLAMIFGLDETTVSGMVTTLGSLIAYIVTEGKVDAAAVSLAGKAETKREA